MEVTLLGCLRLKVVGMFLYLHRQQLLPEVFSWVNWDGLSQHTCSPFAESDDLRGKPAPGHQSTPDPGEAHSSVVDAGGVESITHCPPKIPQMMAAGKCASSSRLTDRAL